MDIIRFSIARIRIHSALYHDAGGGSDRKKGTETVFVSKKFLILNL